MTAKQWAFLIGSEIVAGAGVLAAAGSWAELTTPAGMGGLLVALGAVVVSYFKPSPRQK